MRKAVTMNHLVKLFVLAQVLANAACELGEFEISIPVEVTQMIGTWDYAATFVAATTVVGDSVTCEIAGVTITADNPNALGFGIYGFDAEASGGAVECTGDGTDDFVQELPAQMAVELERSPCCWVLLNLTFPTPLGLMQVENHANPVFVSADDSISADYWNGRVVATVRTRHGISV